MNSFGTRSWCMTPNFSIGSKVYVKASYFDNPRSKGKYSDFFPFKGDTLLEGKVLTVQNNVKSVKVIAE